MHIKSIVLEGFKSYGSRTEIKGFDPLFNAITGLNGTGKSNILDSICFVLGISNLTHVRANSLQDLIYKSGQEGINKATVTIVFDNTNKAQCPSGFENLDEIIITRQIVLGGKCKYLLNGVNTTNKKIQDLFCSVQLNVNNPHFLVMQGHITKVLNMKPLEVLAMMEEAAGTRLYEVKRQDTLKVIKKKDAKLAETRTVINEDLMPKLQRLREERQQFLEYQQTERQLEQFTGLFQVYQYFVFKRRLAKAEDALANGQQKSITFDEKIKENNEAIEQLNSEIEEATSGAKTATSNELEKLKAELDCKQKEEAKSNASVKSIQDNIKSEEKKIQQLQKNIQDDEKTLQAKQKAFDKVKSLFEKLKENDEKDTEAYNLAESKFQALSTGMELNDHGETETLAGQLMNAKSEASNACTEAKQAEMQLVFQEKQLKLKEKESGASTEDYKRITHELQSTEKEINSLEDSIKRLNYSENTMAELQSRSHNLQNKFRPLNDQVQGLQVRHPYTTFRYSDPEPNFDKSSVKGVVCKLFDYIDGVYLTALEEAAGGKLYNVIIDQESTGKKLLKNGNLMTRTTFIPLNKISGGKINQETVKLAQTLAGGPENCQPALSLIKYDKSLQGAMEYVFGNVFVCKNLSVAKVVAFDRRVRRKCVTLEGDTVDPSGVLCGGSRPKGDPILKTVSDMKRLEAESRAIKMELAEVEHKINSLSDAQEQYNTAKRKLDLAKHKRELTQQRLMNTSYATNQADVEKIKSEIADLKEKIKTCKNTEANCNAKVKELEEKMKSGPAYLNQRLKEAEAEMKACKAKAERSKQEWEKRSAECEMLTLEIEDIKKGVATIEEQIKQAVEGLTKLKEEYDETAASGNEFKEVIKNLQDKVKELKCLVAQENKEVQQKIKKKDQLTAQIAEIELEKKRFAHDMTELKQVSKLAKQREQEYLKKIGNNNKYMEEGEALSDKEGEALDRKIKSAQEKKHKLGRSINPQAQTMFEEIEKKINGFIKKEKTVTSDREKLLSIIAELDDKKKKVLDLAFTQVSKDFGSIFSTLLPGANSKLEPVQANNTLKGLQIRVSLGNVWKESLTELSGGQRSLAALALILAMLLFKPAPLYILDEVDAALDLSHTQNIGKILRTHFKQSQFIVVSLKDGMFNNANVLFRTQFLDGVSAVQRTENPNRS